MRDGVGREGHRQVGDLPFRRISDNINNEPSWGPEVEAFTLNISNRSVSFSTKTELLEWAATEKESWQWIDKVSKLIRQQNYRPTPELVRQDSQRLYDAAVAFEQGRQDGSISNVQHAASQYYRHNLTLDSPRGQFLQKLSSEKGPDVAFGALLAASGCLMVGQPQEGRPYSLHLGSTAITAFDLGLSPTETAASFDKLVEHAGSRISSFVDQSLQRETEREDRLNRLQDDAKQDSQRASEQLKEAINGVVTESANAVAKIDATHKTYQEFMRLKAPVSYWTSKADSHSASARWLAIVLVTTTVLLGALLLHFLAGITDKAIEIAKLKDANVYAPLLYVVKGIAGSAAFFWTIRIVLRLYLSEHHLAIDANERAIMLETYLALTNDSKVEPTDRALILAPIFRSTADGIVKDDGAPDILSGHLSKFSQPTK